MKEMSKGTEKVGSSGRFGARYGVKVRRRLKDIEENKSHRHECPNCHKLKVQRVSVGVWQCQSCSTKFAAGAYAPTTKRIVNREFIEERKEEPAEEVIKGE